MRVVVQPGILLVSLMQRLSDQDLMLDSCCLPIFTGLVSVFEGEGGGGCVCWGGGRWLAKMTSSKFLKLIGRNLGDRGVEGPWDLGVIRGPLLPARLHRAGEGFV